MDLYEYQARDLFAAHGVPVLDAVVATTPDEARAGAERLGGTVVIKAQVKVGGRGKAGGVRLAHTPDEAAERQKTNSAARAAASSPSPSSSPHNEAITCAGTLYIASRTADSESRQARACRIATS